MGVKAGGATDFVHRGLQQDPGLRLGNRHVFGNIKHEFVEFAMSGRMPS